MGYTHYFEQNQPCQQSAWEAICKDFRAVVASQGVPIAREFDEPDAPPEISTQDGVIAFNGLGDDGHETMVLERDGNGFQFCKTNQKPYDLAVTALLLIAHHHAPNVWRVNSDGDPDDWSAAMALVQGTLGWDPALPPQVAEAA